jgi:hypothetical protein
MTNLGRKRRVDEKMYLEVWDRGGREEVEIEEAEEAEETEEVEEVEEEDEEDEEEEEEEEEGEINLLLSRRRIRHTTAKTSSSSVCCKRSGSIA